MNFCKSIIFYLVGFVFVPLLAKTQYRQNWGLLQPQPAASLPTGKAPFDVPVRKQKMNVEAVLLKTGSNQYLLNNGWELAEGTLIHNNPLSVLNESYQTTDWYNATVPGTVLSTLVEQGVYPDPYIGLNNMAIPDSLCRKDWWYRIAFESPASHNQQLAWLQFEGINYKANFWLNGRLLGTSVGAFKRVKFNVTELLKSSGKNILVVQILPPPNPGIPHEQSAVSGMGPNGGQLAMDGPTFISSEGWDWVPGMRDRNIGIWQDVRLFFTGAMQLSDPKVVTDLPLPDTTVALVSVSVQVKNNSNQQQTAEVKGTIGDIHFAQTVVLMPGEEKKVEFTTQSHPVLQFKNPKLWWPNGYGAPNLYQLQLQVVQKNRISDEETARFGIREFSYELMAEMPSKQQERIHYSPTDFKSELPLFDYVNRNEFGNRIFIPALYKNAPAEKFERLSDNKNPYLVIKVNGIKIFCKGGNWGMDDGMKRVSRERLEPAFQLHKEANFNMIRNWTGESTEKVFYDLADEYGMLVWNDFWISTEGYNLNPLDQKLWLHNSLDVIRRFRNHASIAIWCPRNEGYAPAGIEEELQTQLLQEDGTRHYIGNSREVNLRQSGDWHFIENPSLYFTKYAEGFSTEIGTFSVPVATTLRKFIKEPDLWPVTDVWHYHDLHSNNQNLEGYFKTIDSLYGKPASLDDFNRKVQLVNYESHRSIFEAWNSKLWQHTSGVLLWMTHPAWPSMIWQTYSWDFETHGSFFGSKKAAEPLHVQLNLHNNKVVVVNTGLKTYKNLQLHISVYDVKGKKLLSLKEPTESVTNTAVELMDLTAQINKLEGVYLVRLELKNEKGNTLSMNDYWKTTNNFQQFNQLSAANLKYRLLKQHTDVWTIQLENAGKDPVVGIKLNVCDAADAVLLPAYFNEGYFNLLPGEKKIITFTYNGTIKAAKLRTEAYNSTPAYHLLK